MFDKRLLKEMPDAKSYIWKQVFCQWIALLMNIVCFIDEYCVDVIDMCFVYTVV